MTRQNDGAALLLGLKVRAAALLGVKAEMRAESYLLNQGLTLVARNWRCPLGELDVVMHDGETLVIIEVRARSSNTYGGALGSITASKRARLMRAVQIFQQAYPEWQDAPVRFDVISFGADGRGQWLRNAFDTDTTT